MRMIRLSVNVNKVATLRNSRGGRSPSVIDAVGVCVAAGAPGITVHPRADRRHITPDDVREIAAVLRTLPPAVEFNIEGDPRSELLELVEEVRPDQCTLVPVVPGEVTSQAGWLPGPERDRLPGVIERLKSLGIRVSLFVDAESDPVRWAASAGADRVELYTEPFARASEAWSGARAPVARAVRGGRDPREFARPGRQRRPRFGPRQSRHVPHAALSGGGVHRSRPDVPGAVRGPRCRGPRIPRGPVMMEVPMKSDGIAFGIAGIAFGLIAGWIIGTQQATVRAPAAAPVASAPATAARTPRGDPRRSQGQRAQVRGRARSRQPHASRRSWRTSISTPSSSMKRSDGTRMR